jgi:transcriptional regulator with XRE-family HTH domain
MAEESLGARIRRLREARGMRQIELAAAMRALGARTEPRDVSRYETGWYDPKLRGFAVLARVLGVSMDVLFHGEGEAARLAAERADADADSVDIEPDQR